eukprot:jgi/Botrbrau1/7335/Bobra.247_3s0030.1
MVPEGIPSTPADSDDKADGVPMGGPRLRARLCRRAGGAPFRCRRLQLDGRQKQCEQRSSEMKRAAMGTPPQSSPLSGIEHFQGEELSKFEQLQGLQACTPRALLARVSTISMTALFLIVYRLTMDDYLVSSGWWNGRGVYFVACQARCDSRAVKLLVRF